MRRTLFYLFVALVLTACAGTAVQVPYDPNRCDRSGDEAQRRAC